MWFIHDKFYFVCVSENRNNKIQLIEKLKKNLLNPFFTCIQRPLADKKMGVKIEYSVNLLKIQIEKTCKWIRKSTLICEMT